jgi:GT2 family glycosyltransferase
MTSKYQPPPSDQMNMPGVAIVVLNWNGLEHTSECLASLRRLKYPHAHVIVVDNGSQAEELVQLRKWGTFLTLLENNSNLGFAGGNNVGIRHALKDPTTDYVLILNNDVVVEPEFLTEMIETASTGRADMISPTVLSYADRKTIDRLGIVISTALLGYDMKQWEGKEPVCPSGCCALYSRRLLEAIEDDGEFFDEEFFAYAEDVDLGLRAVLRGFRGALAPRAIIYHKKSASTAVQSPFSLYHGHRNTIWCLAKTVPAPIVLRHLHWVVAGQLLPLLANATRGRFRLLLRAKIDGLRGIPRMLRKRRAQTQAGRTNEHLLESLLDPRPFYLFPPRHFLRRLLGRE